jgi:hypothetical protein
MNRRHRNTIIGSAAALVLVAGGGAAVAATDVLSPREANEAVLSDAAEQLGVEPSELTEALEQALKNRVDDEVDAGRLTEEQGERLKERIESGDVPLFGLGPPVGHGLHVHFPGLDTAASYLGMTEAALSKSLAEGNTLAEVARERGKPVDGLVQALTKEAADRLEEAVDDGRLTEAQKDEMLDDLKEHITDFVNGDIGPRFKEGPGFHRVPEGPEPPGSTAFAA